VDLGVALGGLAEALTMPFLDRLGPDDPSLERASGTQLAHRPQVPPGKGWTRSTMLSIAAPDSARHYALRADDQPT
jgi:hypothetical protein